MIVSIHQPAYLPWLGYFDKILKSDLFLYLDTVQFQKGSFQNRNKIRTKDGWIWQTVPVQTKGKHYEQTIAEVDINPVLPWQAKHWAAISQNYRKAPCAADWLPRLEPFYHTPYQRLSDLCWDMMDVFNQALGITTPIRKTSDMPPVDGAKSDLILNLCRAVGATTYLSGSQGRGYLNEASFAEAGIAVVYQDYQHPAYQQAYPGFEPYMGVIDLLMNEPNPVNLLEG
ncbi:WbqC family protein [Insolitispirillum peregrinum]|uniref:WbqC-like protein family protein n=1 Tax=Insolitispirillum peregrinum TaxID=80876 RepID=A0A1N7JD52_9PROT|nr:WbqC family protein [Insolitispirillum peregrinum]SIS47237.1 WbqC-like protein family protein [Insolitispirillum peregrinum]